MKSRKLSSRKLRSLIAGIAAFAMVLSLAACNGDDNGNGGNTTTAPQGDGGAEGTGSEQTGEGLPEDNQEPQDFDFGVIAFNSQEVTIKPDSAINVGGNMNTASAGGGGGVIRMAGFVGTRGDFECEIDPDGQHTTLISQNGAFWDNISRIEASAFLTSDNDPDAVANVESFWLLGGLLGFAWRQTGENLLNEFSEDYGGEGYEWGNSCMFNFVWDIDAAKASDGSLVQAQFNPDGDFIFDTEAFDVKDAEEPEDRDYRGGGLAQLGFMLQNDCIDETLEIKINWTNVVIYVHCMDTWNEHVAMVEEVMGYTMSANTANRVVQA
jgi:hypothetical protein